MWRGIFKQDVSTVCLRDPADDFQTKSMLHPILLRAPSRLFPAQGFQKIIRHSKTVISHPKTTFYIVCVNRNHDPAAPGLCTTLLRIRLQSIRANSASSPSIQRLSPCHIC